MSALDQQVAMARGVLSKAAYRRSNENVPVDHRTREADYERAVDALLTTHRRQVLQEVAERVRGNEELGFLHNLSTVKRFADFIQSLASEAP